MGRCTERLYDDALLKRALEKKKSIVWRPPSFTSTSRKSQHVPNVLVSFRTSPRFLRITIHQELLIHCKDHRAIAISFSKSYVRIGDGDFYPYVKVPRAGIGRKSYNVELKNELTTLHIYILLRKAAMGSLETAFSCSARWQFSPCTRLPAFVVVTVCGSPIKEGKSYSSDVIFVGLLISKKHESLFDVPLSIRRHVDRKGQTHLRLVLFPLPLACERTHHSGQLIAIVVCARHLPLLLPLGLFHCLSSACLVLCLACWRLWNSFAKWFLLDKDKTFPRAAWRVRHGSEVVSSETRQDNCRGSTSGTFAVIESGNKEPNSGLSSR